MPRRSKAKRFKITELAQYFGKSRNTVGQWLKDEEVDLSDWRSVLQFLEGKILEMHAADYMKAGNGGG